MIHSLISQYYIDILPSLDTKGRLSEMWHKSVWEWAARNCLKKVCYISFKVFTTPVILIKNSSTSPYSAQVYPSIIQPSIHPAIHYSLTSSTDDPSKHTDSQTKRSIQRCHVNTNSILRKLTRSRKSSCGKVVLWVSSSSDWLLFVHSRAESVGAEDGGTGGLSRVPPRSACWSLPHACLLMEVSQCFASFGLLLLPKHSLNECPRAQTLHPF